MGWNLFTLKLEHNFLFEMRQSLQVILYNNQFLLCYWKREKEKKKPKAGDISQTPLICPVSNGLWVIIKQPFETACMKIQCTGRELQSTQKQFADMSVFGFVFRTCDKRQTSQTFPFVTVYSGAWRDNLASYVQLKSYTAWRNREFLFVYKATSWSYKCKLKLFRQSTLQHTGNDLQWILQCQL